MSARTLKVQAPHMRGDDVKLWQESVNAQFAKLNIGYRIATDGDYGAASRDASATLLHALGIAQSEMAGGVTPALRSKVRRGKRSAAERSRFAARVAWRRKLRARYAVGSHVATPIAKILGSSWGWHPGHDGVDLICREDAPIYAICDGVVVDVRSGGWWGKGAQPSAGHPVSDGDGIIQIRCSTDVGPFTKGMIFGYGHAEHATVRVGQPVKAGQQIGKAGFANAAHVHFMARGPHPGSDRPRGIGDRDPMPFVRFAARHS
jgi:murein DD-endopeptidase MepM/ murein hydrolase activator NlpD